MEIKFTKFDKEKDFIEPKRASSGASGFDMYSINKEPIIINPGEYKLIDSNVSFEIPYGYEGQVRSRSGLAFKHGIFVLNSPGTLDHDYSGPCGIILMNMGKEDFTIDYGMRIAQVVFVEVETVELKYSEKIIDSKRGSNGFGSTGIH